VKPHPHDPAKAFELECIFTWTSATNLAPNSRIKLQCKIPSS